MGGFSIALCWSDELALRENRNCQNALDSQSSRRLKKFLLASHLVLFALMCALLPSAQAAFSLKVAASPSRVSLGSSVTYTITISNSVNLVQSVQVVNQFPTDATIINAQNNFSPGRVTTNAGNVMFSVDLLPNGSTASFSLQLQPNSGGTFANKVTVQSLAGVESPVSTNVVINVSAPEVDLGLSVAGIPPTAVIGDSFDYTLTVTNSSSVGASGVTIQSAMPSGIKFLAVTPTVAGSIFSQNTLTLPIVSLTNASAVAFTISVQALATNNAFGITNFVSASQNTDTSTNNNSVVSTIKVLPLVTNTVRILSVSPMVFNRQTALMDQVVVVTNLTTNVISSVRILATNLVAPNAMFNAVGTNTGRPFVVIPVALGPTNSASVSIQYFVTNRTAIDVGLLASEGPSLISLAVPAGTAIPISRVVHLRNSNLSSVYLEFPTTIGRKYSLVYSATVDNAGTNRVAVYPPFVANSTHGQFVDTGPQVTGEGDRFYTVIEQP